MPLIHSSSKSARGENIRREIDAGKDPKQAVAIAYDVQRRAAHEHATTMAAADHLHSRGHIDGEHRDRIHAHVRRQMTGDHAKPPPRAPSFGSLSGSGHYISTVNPDAA